MNETCEIKARVIYEKDLQSRYISHLDTIDIICKALRRLQLPYLVTSGCHIRPKISFGAPLPLGHASRCEQFILSLSETVTAEWLKNELSQQLPAGMTVVSVELPAAEEKKGANGDLVEYRLGFSCEASAHKALAFLSNPETSFSLVSKGKTKSFSIGEAVQKVELKQENSSYVISAEFIQGQQSVPSVSKIVTALAEHLQSARDDLFLIERISLKKL